VAVAVVAPQHALPAAEAVWSVTAVVVAKGGAMSEPMTARR
jgi:hypothetical protein